MTGPEMVEIRNSMNRIGRRAFARHLGYTGTPETNFKVIMRYEMGIREIPDDVARKVRRLKEVFDSLGHLPAGKAMDEALSAL